MRGCTSQGSYWEQQFVVMSQDIEGEGQEWGKLIVRAHPCP